MYLTKKEQGFRDRLHGLNNERIVLLDRAARSAGQNAAWEYMCVLSGTHSKPTYTIGGRIHDQVISRVMRPKPKRRSFRTTMRILARTTRLKARNELAGIRRHTKRVDIAQWL